MKVTVCDICRDRSKQAYTYPFKNDEVRRDLCDGCYKRALFRVLMKILGDAAKVESVILSEIQLLQEKKR
jgi:hypothetical protein